jgi:hypothetical protein
VMRAALAPSDKSSEIRPILDKPLHSLPESWESLEGRRVWATVSGVDSN